MSYFINILQSTICTNSTALSMLQACASSCSISAALQHVYAAYQPHQLMHTFHSISSALFRHGTMQMLMRLQEYYIMALSQPRSEQKVDELLGNVRRESTQEEVNMGDFGQAPEQHEPASEAEEPLRKWRNGGSIPREFQGRSTSSFINRVVRLSSC